MNYPTPTSQAEAARYQPEIPCTRSRAWRNIGQAAPPITPTQWLLSLAALLLAAFGCLTPSSTSAQITTILTSGIWLLVSVHAIRNTLRSGLLGQAVMFCSVWVMFYFEALRSALFTPPFSAPPGYPGVQGQFDVDIIHHALLHLCLFQFTLLLGYASARGTHSLSRWLGSRCDVVQGRRALQLVLASFMVLALGSVYRWNWPAVSRALLGSYRVRMAQDAFLLTDVNFPLLWYLLPVGLYGTAVLFVGALQTRGLRRYVAGALALAGIIFVLLLSSRHYLLVIVIPVGAVLLKRFYRHSGVSRVLLLGAAALVVFWALQAQTAVRGSGWKSLFRLSPQQVLSTDPGGQFEALLFAESLVPREHDFFGEPTPLVFLTYWVPRRFWQNKPVDNAWQYFDERLTAGSTTWNVTPTAIGQFYMGFGLMGVCAIGCCLGMLCRVADDAVAVLTLAAHQAAIVFAATTYVFVVNSFRYVAPFYAVYSVAGLLGMIILTRQRRGNSSTAGCHPIAKGDR